MSVSHSPDEPVRPGGIAALLAELQSEARRRRLTKVALAAAAQIHPNTLRNFAGFRTRKPGRHAWRPTIATIEALEPVLLSPEALSHNVRESHRTGTTV